MRERSTLCSRVPAAHETPNAGAVHPCFDPLLFLGIHDFSSHDPEKVTAISARL